VVKLDTYMNVSFLVAAEESDIFLHVVVTLRARHVHRDPSDSGRRTRSGIIRGISHHDAGHGGS
jgi:hypothetical protein